MLILFKRERFFAAKSITEVESYQTRKELLKLFRTTERSLFAPHLFHRCLPMLKQTNAQHLIIEGKRR
jgi:hypothetical protein